MCLLLAAAYIIWAWGRFWPFVYVVIAGPLAVIAVLYAVNWRLRSRKAKPNRRERPLVAESRHSISSIAVPLNVRFCWERTFA